MKREEKDVKGRKVKRPDGGEENKKIRKLNNNEKCKHERTPKPHVEEDRK